MKANAAMARRWGRIQEQTTAGVPLTKTLAELVVGPLVDVCGALVFESFLSSSMMPPSSQDLTGFEATVNKIHVADFAEECSNDELLVQAVEYAQELIKRLKDAGRPCRIILSLDPDSPRSRLGFS